MLARTGFLDRCHGVVRVEMARTRTITQITDSIKHRRRRFVFLVRSRLEV